jgi:hypothetical protein
MRRMGWTVPAIGAEVGIAPGGLTAALRRDTWTDRMAQRLAEGYERLCGTPGPSRFAALRAEREGCAAPIAWDGIDIDDPAAVPDLGERGRRSGADLIAEYDHLLGCGVSPERAVIQLGVRRDSLDKARSRAASAAASEDAGEGEAA